ncbi:DUF1217 domain-containing protein [Aureimonas ureilytica]|uniref:DUF1217 domain-containing protein n=1 Tax=Aureimonas ureilytica TaxID=401562 RepID=UPI0012E3E3F0|nr:DUF1217 domain-containing protein [Aureimonas ureilytica]
MVISTLLNYRLYTNNMAQTLERLSSQEQVKRDKSYYEENIGKVTSVDQFLGDYKLYSYAMKAYGLEDQISAKGMIRKVLQSDLTDSSSYANKLADQRYRDFASAFSFGSSKAPTAQSSAQTERLTEAYAERVDTSAPIAAKATSYYSDHIGAITSIDEFVADRGLLDVALRASGFPEPSIISSDYAKQVLTGDASNGDASWATLRTQFSAATGSGTARSWVAQTAKMASNLVYTYNAQTGNATSPQAKQADTDYLNAFFSADNATKTVSAFTGDERLLKFALTAMGSEIVYASGSAASYLQDPSSIPSTVSSVEKARFQSLHDMLGVQSDGTMSPPSDGLDKVISGYETNYKTAFNKSVNFDTTEFRASLADVKSVTDLMAASSVDGKRRTLNYVLKAVGIDPNTVSFTKIRAVLTSDPTDPNSYVSKLKDERYTQLAAAFNFDENGKLRPERLIQSTSDQTRTGTLYAATFGKDLNEATKAQIKADTKTYLAAVGSAVSLNDLLGDKKAIQYALTAYGVKNKDLSKDELRKILTSDLADPKSYANTQTDKAIAKFAAAFNFETDGSVRATDTGGQQGADRLATDKLYLLQTLEEQAGETSEGTRLALYFLRKAPALTSAYGILADKALYQVVRTALGLPDGMVAMDTDKQAAMIQRKLDVKDFTDEKKLDKFVSRFAGMYDVANQDSSSNPVVQLFGGGSGSGILGIF